MHVADIDAQDGLLNASKQPSHHLLALHSHTPSRDNRSRRSPLCHLVGRPTCLPMEILDPSGWSNSMRVHEGGPKQSGARKYCQASHGLKLSRHCSLQGHIMLSRQKWPRRRAGRTGSLHYTTLSCCCFPWFKPRCTSMGQRTEELSACES
jgi:hypothetical protein